MTRAPSKQLFPAGMICCTPGVMEALTAEQISVFLQRHMAGDWGDLDASDLQQNEFALHQRLRLFSAYGIGDKRVWVITEADRSVTTVLLPNEY